MSEDEDKPTDQEIEEVNRLYYAECVQQFIQQVEAQNSDVVQNSKDDETVADLMLELWSLSGYDSHLIDVGSGPGAYVHLARDYGFAAYTGVEPSAAMIAYARTHAESATFIQADIYSLPTVLERTYESFICLFVLPFIPRSRTTEALTAIRSILPPTGGSGVIALHLGENEGWSRGELPGERDCYVLGWTRAMIEPHLAAAGFFVRREVIENERCLWLLVETI